MSHGFVDQMRGEGIKVPRTLPEPTFADLALIAEGGASFVSEEERRKVVDRARAALGFRPVDWDAVDEEDEVEAEVVYE